MIFNDQLNLLMCKNKPEVSYIDIGASVDTSDMKPALDGSDESATTGCVRLTIALHFTLQLCVPVGTM